MLFNNSEVKCPKIYCIHFKECSPKKCTSLKLKKFGLLKIINKRDGILKKGIVLNPFSSQEISKNDRARILKFGLIVFDCSWKNILHLQEFNVKYGRKLPPLIAVNPTNYGRWEKLSSVEAVAATLYITEFYKCAELLLSKFPWGADEFFKKNFYEKL